MDVWEQKDHHFFYSGILGLWIPRKEISNPSALISPAATPRGPPLLPFLCLCFNGSDDIGGLDGLPELPPLPSSQSSDQSDLLARMRPSPEERLTMIVDLDEERAASILRRWVRQEAA